ncbi:hypothetical protein MTsPCn5_16510 [Croceitalea sp. MTPC5]|uniref:hypothetical protein n=1 Tax=Croceitalea sp. MTPC5 TaxID=3056565 RepID=UPI002B36D705|nr:hypothetical protein MTsPCn5_16510 [Croceitalea sp. MTPC5]
MPRKIIVVAITFFICCFGYTQQEATIWYFGASAGIDCNTGTPIALTDRALVTQEGRAVTSDFNNALLFRTDGSTVYYRNHSLIFNSNHHQMTGHFTLKR